MVAPTMTHDPDMSNGSAASDRLKRLRIDLWGGLLQATCAISTELVRPKLGGQSTSCIAINAIVIATTPVIQPRAG
jgi:hypothetical protein